MQSSLQALRIPKSETRPPQAAPPVPAPEENAPPAPVPSAFGKISVSLYPPDVEAVDRMVDLIRRHCGIHMSRSHAFKMAVRFAVKSMTPEDFRREHQEVRGEDRRFSGNKRNP